MKKVKNRMPMSASEGREVKMYVPSIPGIEITIPENETHKVSKLILLLNRAKDDKSKLKLLADHIQKNKSVRGFRLPRKLKKKFLAIKGRRLFFFDEAMSLMLKQTNNIISKQTN